MWMPKFSFLIPAAFAVCLLFGTHAGPAQDAPTGIRLPVNLQADQRTEVRARIEGYVAKVHVDIGDSVIQGQLLVTLDAPELEAEVLRKKQMVRQAEAHLRVTESAVETARARLLQARASLEEQTALKRLRVTQRDRYAALVAEGAVQREKLDEAEYALLAVNAVTKKIEADMAAAEAEVDASVSEVEFAKSGIEVAQAEYTYAEVQNQMRSIKAPFSGLITDRQVDPGTLVNPGSMASAPLLVLEGIDVLRAIMTVPAEQAPRISVGATVSFAGMQNAANFKAPDGGPTRVSRISQTLEMKTRTMRVEIDIANPLNQESGRFEFLSGQYGTATIHVP